MKNLRQFIQSLNIFSVSKELSHPHLKTVKEIDNLTNALKALDNVSTSKLKTQRVSVREYQKLIDDRRTANLLLSPDALNNKDETLAQFEQSITTKVNTASVMVGGSAWITYNLFVLSNSIENDYVRIPLQGLLACAALGCATYANNRKHQFYQLRSSAAAEREAISESIIEKKFAPTPRTADVRFISDYFEDDEPSKSNTM